VPAAEAAPPPDLDHRGSRRLGPVEERVWYAVAFASYVPVAIWQKGLLNWFAGPAWLVAVVSLGPAAWDRLRRIGRRRP
jgi:hypothetical protein